jgi:hypothetical protein
MVWSCDHPYRTDTGFGRLIVLEPQQAELLERICAGPLRTADELRNAGAFASDGDAPATAKGKHKNKT